MKNVYDRDNMPYTKGTNDHTVERHNQPKAVSNGETRDENIDNIALEDVEDHPHEL